MLNEYIDNYTKYAHFNYIIASKKEMSDFLRKRFPKMKYLACDGAYHIDIAVAKADMLAEKTNTQIFVIKNTEKGIDNK